MLSLLLAAPHTMSNTVQADSLIRWHYQLYLADGYLVEASEDPQGEILQLGAGAFHPNIEAALVGLPVGEPIRLVIMASEAFGLPDSDAVQTLPLSDFPADMALQIGHIISFTLPSGQEIPGKIQHIGTDSVQVDFNHPLAGHNLRFELEIIEIL
jgi:FKBP-type peptidyl-prolyl cis-trans isomerase SlpA